MIRTGGASAPETLIISNKAGGDRKKFRLRGGEIPDNALKHLRYLEREAFGGADYEGPLWAEEEIRRILQDYMDGVYDE